MDNMTYLESLEQSAEKLDECIEMLSPAAGYHVINTAIRSLKLAKELVSLAISDEQLQRAVMAREHMQEGER